MTTKEELAKTASTRSQIEHRAADQRLRLGLASGLALLVVLQIVVVATLLRTGNDLSELRQEIGALTASEVTPALAADDLVDLGSSPSSLTNQSALPGSGPVSTDPGGDLPRFLGGEADPALGRSLGELTSNEYYSGENIALDSADGVARAYMVWAHWCPFCQEELPMMAEWQDANEGAFEDFELITVTTAMDAAADNPLIPYLDERQFPFPVLVDDDGSIARQLGVNALPFWVFTTPDGRVVGRAAGFIGADDLTTVIEELDQLAAAEAVDS